MTVLHLAPFLEPGFAGGLQRYVRELVRRQVRMGMRVRILSAGSPGPAADGGARCCDGAPAELVRAPSLGVVWRTPVAPSLPGLARRLAEGADVVHLHAPNPALEAAAWAVLAASRPPVLVVTLHNGYPLCEGAAGLLGCAGVALAARAFASLLARASAVIAPHPEFLAAMPRPVADALYRRPPAFVLPGCDHGVFRPQPGAERSADEVVFAARPRPEKGGELLVEALRRAPGLRLTILAPTRGSPHLGRLLALARRRLPGRVRLQPDPDDADLAAAFSRAAAVVAPSLALDSFNLSLLEAAACGAACVRSDAPGLRWATFALEVAGRDPKAWAAAIEQAVQRREALGAAALRAARDFTWERTAEGTAAVYEQALASRAGRSA